MHDHEWVTEEFEASRTRLQAIAGRMLGSRVEAEDAVQETWLRVARVDPASIENLGGLLTTIVSRVCLDRLRARGARPEHPVEEVPARADDDATIDPAEEAMLAESVAAALMVVLDELAPAERVAFVLHDVFAVPFDEVASVLDRSPDAVRQLASRARRRVHGNAPTAQVDLVRQRDVVNAFLRAARDGDFDALMGVLHPDVRFVPDAATTRMASLSTIEGAESVANQMSGWARGATLAVIDGMTGFVWTPGGQIRGVVSFALVDDQILEIAVTSDAERIAAFDIVTLDG